MVNTKHIVFIGGPTASGKTTLAIELARFLSCEIVSADSRQIYRGMAIGSAQPSPEELAAVPHHFIASHSPTETISAGAYERLALERIKALFKSSDFVVCVGGSGLFMKAVYHGFHDLPEVPEHLRNELNARLKDEGLRTLSQELMQRDAQRATEIDLQNPQRVIRALELVMCSGKTFAELTANQNKDRGFTYSKFQPNINREALYQNINQRVDAMYEKGLLKEVEELREFWACNSLKTLGYQENIKYLNGEITLTEAKNIVAKNTRNFAKRQITWFKKEAFTPVSTIDEILVAIKINR